MSLRLVVALVAAMVAGVVFHQLWGHEFLRPVLLTAFAIGALVYSGYGAVARLGTLWSRSRRTPPS